MTEFEAEVTDQFEELGYVTVKLKRDGKVALSTNYYPPPADETAPAPEPAEQPAAQSPVARTQQPTQLAHDTPGKPSLEGFDGDANDPREVMWWHLKSRSRGQGNAFSKAQYRDLMLLKEANGGDLNKIPAEDLKNYLDVNNLW